MFQFEEKENHAQPAQGEQEDEGDGVGILNGFNRVHIQVQVQIFSFSSLSFRRPERFLKRIPGRDAESCKNDFRERVSAGFPPTTAQQAFYRRKRREQRKRSGTKAPDSSFVREGIAISHQHYFAPIILTKLRNPTPRRAQAGDRPDKSQNALIKIMGAKL
jgi:hypothetical protein